MEEACGQLGRINAQGVSGEGPPGKAENPIWKLAKAVGDVGISKCAGQMPKGRHPRMMRTGPKRARCGEGVYDLVEKLHRRKTVERKPFSHD